MSRPRQILPGTTYLITRRCFGRHLFLRPSAFVNQVILYCLAIAAKKYEILLHQITVMSNHYHMTATDPHGQLPEFMRYFNEFVAKIMNAHLGRWESFFAPGSYSAVKLTDEKAALEKMVYSITNPVDAGLVAKSNRWPGVCTMPHDIGISLTIKRPKKLFRENGPLPETATLTISPVPEALNPKPHTFVDRLDALVQHKEAEICAQMAQKKRLFMGPHAVRKQCPFDTPQSYEPRRQLNPRVAGRDRQRRIEALVQLKEFLAAYRTAWTAFRDGVRDVVFPPGTYALRLRHGVCCGPGC